MEDIKHVSGTSSFAGDAMCIGDASLACVGSASASGARTNRFRLNCSGCGGGRGNCRRAQSKGVPFIGNVLDVRVGDVASP
jgi:hypothetical protein